MDNQIQEQLFSAGVNAAAKIAFDEGVAAEQARILDIVAGLTRCDGVGVDTVRRDDVIRKIQSRHTQLAPVQR